MLTGRIGPVELPEELHEATKLTVYVGRQQRVGGRPAYVAVVDAAAPPRVAGATVLLGVDGTAHGVRQRASFFVAQRDVPLMIISVGDGARGRRALPELGAMLRPSAAHARARPRLQARRRRLAEPRHLPETDPAGCGCGRS